MHITLNGRAFALKSLSRKELKKLDTCENPDAVSGFWETQLTELYGLTPEDMDEWSNRDVMLLARATALYSRGLNLSDIKNLVAGGDGEVMSTNTEPAATA